ncbi:MAG: ABC transporter permease [Candidatus Bilamarchaeaceae archaeon]
MSELNAVYFMWKREMIRFFRSKSRVIGSLGMPFFMLAILGTGLNNAISIPGMEGNYIAFITPGILSMVLLFASVFSGGIVIIDRQFGFLKETLVAPVKRTSIVIGKALGGATAAVLQGIIMLGIAMLLGVSISFANALLALFVMLLISFGFVALGIAIASVMEDMHGFQLIMNFLVMPMFFLSGALFPLNSAPEIVRIVSHIDPLTYAVEALRYLLMGSSMIPIALSMAVLVLFSITCTLIAAYLFGKIED